LAAVDTTGRNRFAYCGLSLGGMIGQWLGAHAPDRLEALVLANTSPRMADPSIFDARRRTVLDQGMRAIEEAVMQRFISLASGTPAAESVRNVLLSTDPKGYAGCCSAIRDMDHRPLLAGIKVPVLVIGGDDDQSTPWTGHGEVLAQRIPAARQVKLPGAHLSNIERPASFTSALFDFLLPKADPLSAGMAVRRAVLSNAHVDRAQANATEFTREFQDLITRYAWGEIWTRPGLSPRVRRLLVLAMTASLGRWEEFRLHVRTGIAAELEMPDLKEVLLQTGIYAGIPAANTAFHIASEELTSRQGPQ
jgi:3-oxoadipate enol-lactonase/4-carboxymuconolactone decarboxylase